MRHPRALLPLILTALGSCTLGMASCAGNIQELYETRRLYALERATSAPEGWLPEASVALSQSMVEQALNVALTHTLSQMKPIDLKVATLKPRLRLERLELVEDRSCADCVGFKVRLSGSVTATVAGVESALPLGLDLGAGLRFTTQEQGELREVRVQPARLNSFALDTQSRLGMGLSLNDTMQDWAAGLLKQVQPASLGTFGGAELPVLDLRVRSRGAALTLELLTDAAHGAPLSQSPATPRKGWVARVSEATLLDHARRAAFQLGEITMDVYGEPVSLDLDGDRFTLGLRVWRLKGLGWWREYTIHGRIGVVDNRLTLTAERVEAGDRSPGARLADPLSTLGERLILKAIEDAAQQALPASQASEVSEFRLLVRVTQATGQGDALELGGEAELRPARAGQDKAGAGGSGSTSDDAQRKQRR